jgi:hypothetical protein
MTTATGDVIQDLADDLLARALQADVKGGVYVYDIDDMLHEKRKFPKLPAVFLLYRSGVATNKKMMQYIFDLYICAGRDRQNRIDGSARLLGAGLLTELRRSIVTAECTPTTVGRVWEFLEESPVEIEPNVVIYRQSWGVTAVQFC